MLAVALFVGILSFFPAYATAHTGFGAVQWDQLLDSGSGSGILFGARISGPSPFARNPDFLFRPASTAKLFTAGNALDRLGASFRFRTTLQWHRVDPGDPSVISGLTLIGGGDPTWGMEEYGETSWTRVDSLASELMSHGVREIIGDISVIPDDPRWNDLRIPEGWTASERVSCDGSLAQAFNVRGNCANYLLSGPARGHWEDDAITMPVRLNIRQGSTTSLRVTETSDGFEISGTLRKLEMADSLSFSLPVRSVDQWVKNLFLKSLSRNGITLKPGNSKGDPTDILVIESPELRSILKPFLKHSLNLIGDAIFKIVGRNYGPGSQDLVSASQYAVREYISWIEGGSARMPGFEGKTVLWDGSGLSYESAVTPSVMILLLENLSSRPDFEFIWDALPIAGVDGTLRNRMKDTAAEGILRAKTGTLNGTYNLAGYVPKLGADGRISEVVPFVVLTQTVDTQKNEARAAEDRVGAALARIVNGHQTE